MQHVTMSPIARRDIVAYNVIVASLGDDKTVFAVGDETIVFNRGIITVIVRI